MINILVSMIAIFGMTQATTWLQPAWEARGFEKMRNKWDEAYLYSALAGVFAAAVMNIRFSNAPYIVLGVSATVWALTFSTYTDVVLHKAPKEIVHAAMWFVFPSMVLAFIDLSRYNISGHGPQFQNQWSFLINNPFKEALFATIAWTVLVTVLMFVAGRGMGMADTRLLWLVGYTFSWSVGIMNMLWLFVGAAIIQLLLFIPSHYLNWGVKVETKSGAVKRAVPFIPALMASFVIGGITLMFVTVL